ncbi:alpha/beta hydrolase family protein [Nisaea sediminum]|uniref:hypothetical protein n=1 Tax=Nisaea sediminum TaxID=2775867 RepID=UPI001867CA1A|nr:hypothetical protein [Nisaea sediminum]
MANTITDLSPDELIQLLSGKYYGMVYLGLANAAYTSAANKLAFEIERDLKKALEDTQYIPSLPDINQVNEKENLRKVDGAWHLEWGPGIAEDLSNLVYIASYRSPASEVYFFVVGIRGTDVSSGPIGDLDQIFEDLYAFAAPNWTTYLNSGVDVEVKIGDVTECRHYGPPPKLPGSRADIGGCVAAGTIAGFDKIAGLKGKLRDPSSNEFSGDKMYLVDALADLLANSVSPISKSHDIPIIVTGHSLGGCQTQVMTSYLAWQFGDQTVIGHPFAPSTAGDAGFAAQKAFEYGCFWRNTLDLVPAAFGRLPPIGGQGELMVSWAANNLWTGFSWPHKPLDPAVPGPELPEKKRIEDLISKHGKDIYDIHYSRPSAGMVDVELDGYLPEPDVIQAFLDDLGKDKEDPKGGLAQLMWQHFPPNYQTLMWDQQGSELVYFNYQSYK